MRRALRPLLRAVAGAVRAAAIPPPIVPAFTRVVSLEDIPHSLKMIAYWRGKCNRMETVEAKVAAAGRAIGWRLAPSSWDVSDWAIGQIDVVLRKEYVNRFYIGITWRPAWRWDGDRESSHRFKGYTRMYLLACHVDPSVIINAEIAVIARFRPYDRKGIKNLGGDFKCQNKNPGWGGRDGEWTLPLLPLRLFCMEPPPPPPDGPDL